MTLDTRSEDQLILLLAQRDLPLRLRDRVQALLGTTLNWRLIREHAIQQEIYPLIYRNLERREFYGVPDQTRLKLDALYKINSFRNAQLTEQSVPAEATP